jgi:hypothetical protein
MLIHFLWKNQSTDCDVHLEHYRTYVRAQYYILLTSYSLHIFTYIIETKICVYRNEAII